MALSVYCCNMKRGLSQMKRLLLLSTALLVTGPVIAADLVVADDLVVPAYDEPVTDWTGFYVGINGGVSQGDFLHPMTFTDEANPDTDYVGGSLDITGGGFIGGVQAGFNYQLDSVVLGVEGDIQASSVNGTTSASIGVLETIELGGPLLLTPDTQISADIGTSLDWFGTLRARAGVLINDQTLLYVTGGLAYGHTTTAINASGTIGLDVDIVDDPETEENEYELALEALSGEMDAMGEMMGEGYAFESNADRVGYAAGVGIEYAITDNVTLKTEYLYTDLGSASVFDGEIFSDFLMDADTDLAFHTVRAGLNLQF